MEKKSNFLIKLVLIVLDFFYPIVKKFVNRHTYYYIACGGGNTFLSFIIYYFCYHNFLHKEDLDLGFYVFKSHMAAFFISFGITFPIGFLLSKYIVWSESYLTGNKQLFRHLILVVIFVIINYLLLKLFVEIFNWWAMPSQVLTTIIIVIFSYLAQKYYSFKN